MQISPCALSLCYCMSSTQHAYPLRWTVSVHVPVWTSFATTDQGHSQKLSDRQSPPTPISYSPTFLLSTWIHSMASISTEPPTKRSKMANSDAGPSTPSENPYLAHLAPKAGNGNGSGSGSGSNGVPAASGKSPLNGLVPRMVTTEQAKNILVRPPWTAKL